jgi:hypothetical protein
MHFIKMKRKKVLQKTIALKISVPTTNQEN